MVELSNEARELLTRFQTQNQQLQELTAQKQNMEMKKIEIDEALKEIEDKNEIYKETAGLLMKKDKEQMKKNLQEEKELIEIKTKKMNESENQLKEQMQKDRSKLENMMQSQGQSNQQNQ